MNRKTWLAALVLTGAALLGSRWMQAGDQPPAFAGAEVIVPGTPAPLDADPGDSAPPAPGAIDKFQTVPTDAGNAPRGAEAAADYADSAPRQGDQNLTLEWVGPEQIKKGQPFVYEIVVRNNGPIAAYNVMVRDRFAPEVKIKAIQPKGTPTEQGYVWNIGTLKPRQEHRIKIEMVADQKGSIVCQATVTATSPAAARFQVSEPKLVIRQTSSEKVAVGDPVAITIVVSNPGDGTADDVVIKSALSEGLKHDSGNEFSYQLGSLAAGETRSLQVVCAAMAGGEQVVRSTATAEAGALKAEAASEIHVSNPKLVLAMTAPTRRYLDRPASCVVKVSNPGDAAANNVKVEAVVPPGFEFQGASNGGRFDQSTRVVSWFVGTVDAAETKELSYECVAVQIGEHKHMVTAMGQRGLKADANASTAVEGISALLLEVVDVDDPVEVGSDTAYEIRVTNQGSREATSVQIEALLPPQMKLRSAQGPVKYQAEGQHVIFAPLPKLAPRADVIYRVFVRGTTEGDARFQARLNSDSLAEPVIEEESTKVYD